MLQPLGDDETSIQLDEMKRSKNSLWKSTWNIERGVLILDR